jgi:hypothetical protein
MNTNADENLLDTMSLKRGTNRASERRPRLSLGKVDFSD